MLLLLKGSFYITSVVESSALDRGCSSQGRINLNEHARRGPAQVRLFLENTGISQELVLSTEYRDALSGSNVLDCTGCIGSSLYRSELGQRLLHRSMPSVGHGVVPARGGGRPLSSIILHAVAFDIGNNQGKFKHNSLGSESGERQVCSVEKLVHN